MVMISVLVLLGLGLVTATVLAVASRVFHVEEDPRVQAKPASSADKKHRLQETA